MLGRNTHICIFVLVREGSFWELVVLPMLLRPGRSFLLALTERCAPKLSSIVRDGLGQEKMLRSLVAGRV